MATTTVYLLNYNNYYNRIIKKEDSVASYISAGTLIATQANANFNPNDGVYAEFIFNTSNGNGDYVIVSTDGEIDSRWFVIENRRNLGIQHTVRLYRDTIADNYNATITAPAFIEKATLSESDPMIFNPEQMTFNQIKSGEYTLRDETAVPWVVGYIPRDFASDSAQTITANLPYTGTYDESVNGIANWSYYSYKDVGQKSYFSNYKWRINIGVGLVGGSTAWGGYKLTFDENKTTSKVVSRVVGSEALQGRTATSTMQEAGYDNYEDYLLNDTTLPSTLVAIQSPTLLKNYTNSAFRSVNNSTAYNIKNQNGKVILDNSTNKYWLVNVTTTTATETQNVTSANAASLYNALNIANATGMQNAFSTYSTTPDNSSFNATYTYQLITLTLTEIVTTCTVTIPTSRYHLNDNPWDMIAIPFGELEIYNNGVLDITTNKDAAMAISQAWSAALGTGTQFDFQLLPFCPIRYMIKSDGSFDYGSAIKQPIYDPDGNIISYVFWGRTSTFTIQIDTLYDLDGTTSTVETIGTVTNKKIQSQTEFFRLVSPNYNGQFEFNAAKNNGISYFECDCTYIPFNPYIHVQPNFGGLYGADYDDARGLICQGDFSLPQVSSAWAEYQYANKNYQNSFNRDIENMEYTQKMGMIQSGISSAASALSTGIGVGSLAGPIAGIAMGAMSAAGAAADLAIQNDINKHAIDYKQDQFGYQLGNIKALNQSIAKNTAFTANNKIFPILEFYKATDEEITALQNKITYNGMTVMRIGTVGEFIQESISYIKGKIIRLDSLTDDYTMANTIAQEIDKGVFI